MRGEDQLIQVAFGDEDSLLLTSHAVGDGVPFRYPIAVILDRLVRVAVAQCGGGILCADVDGLAVDDGAQVAEDRVGEQGQIGAHVESPSSEASRRCTVQRTRPLRC